MKNGRFTNVYLTTDPLGHPVPLTEKQTKGT